MARAGDGLPRSSTRRSTAMISLRVTKDERHAVQRMADALEDAGCPREDAEAFRQHSRVVHGMQIALIRQGDVLRKEYDLFEGGDDVLEDDDAG